MADTIDNLSIEISAKADAAVQSLTRLQNAIKPLGGAGQAAAGGMKVMTSETEKADSTLQRVSKDASTAGKNVRNVGKDAEDAGKSAKKGTSGISSFWGALKRIAFYRFVRSVIREITDAFKTGITNLYHWSKEVTGADRTFSASMDRMATSALYLKNSLGAMVAPLINSLVPVLDVIIDKVVEVINFFNMLISAISGADTYTVAKKAATVWDESATKTSKAAKELKRTLLGFDEINRLNSNSTSRVGSSSKTPDYSSMFETKPLEGIFKKIADITKDWPDWLKWLLGIGGAGLAAWGLSQLPKLIGNILDWLKKLFTINIPDWFRWLFGPKGDKNIDLKFPDNIELPDADIKTNLEKGDWSVIDELNGKPVYLSPRLNNKAGVLYDNFKRDWDNSGSKTLYFEPRLNNTAKVLYDRFKKDWDNSGSKTLYFEPRLNNSARVVYERFKEEWNKIPPIVDVNIKLIKWGWTTVREWLGLNDPVNANINLRKWGWSYIRTWIGLDDPVTANINLRKWGWEYIRSWLGLDDPVVANISLARYGWTTIHAWIGQHVTVYISLARNGWASLQNWVGTQVHVAVHLMRGNFYSLSDWVGTWIPVEVYLQRGNFWSLSDWTGDEIWVKVNYYMGDGGSLVASGGGGSTSGGGAGRGRRNANGGIFYGGSWKDIPQYAGGTNNAHGTLFLAGEAGPEIVGHVGGRTEVLNKSQLAATMYAAVNSAMRGVTLDANFYGDTAASGSNNFEEYIRQDNEAMRTQNELLRQQNELLRQINDKELSVSTTAMNKAQAYMNRRAGATIVPVGT